MKNLIIYCIYILFSSIKPDALLSNDNVRKSEFEIISQRELELAKNIQNNINKLIDMSKSNIYKEDNKLIKVSLNFILTISLYV